MPFWMNICPGRFSGLLSWHLIGFWCSYGFRYCFRYCFNDKAPIHDSWFIGWYHDCITGHMASGTMVSRWRAGRCYPGCHMTSGTVLSRLAIWRAGRSCSDSWYGERDGAVPTHHMASWLRPRSSLCYLRVIQMAGEWWSAFFSFHYFSRGNCSLKDWIVQPESFSYNNYMKL